MKKLLYFTPETEVCELETLAMLCTSGNINDMVVLGEIAGDTRFE